MLRMCILYLEPLRSELLRKGGGEGRGGESHYALTAPGFYLPLVPTKTYIGEKW